MNTQSATKEVALAPMVGITDGYCRALYRVLEPKAQLFTEMIATSALIHGGPPRQLKTLGDDTDTVVQLAGASPTDLEKATAMILGMGYKKINLNLGCPSPKVTKGGFGACLLAEPDKVAELVNAMSQDGAEVSVKIRTGVIRSEKSPPSLANTDITSSSDINTLVEKVIDAGCDTFYVHARKAILGGLSPAANRRIPQLEYDILTDLVDAYPQAKFIANGGINNLTLAKDLASGTAGVMIGRAAVQSPAFLSDVCASLLPATDHRPVSLNALVDSMRAALIRLLECAAEGGVRPQKIMRHLVGLFRGQPSARKLRGSLCHPDLTWSLAHEIVNEMLPSQLEQLHLKNSHL